MRDIEHKVQLYQTNLSYECSCVQGRMAGEPVNVNEYQELARQVLPKMYYDFYAGGAEGQYTLKENIEAFHRIM